MSRLSRGVAFVFAGLVSSLLQISVISYTRSTAAGPLQDFFLGEKLILNCKFSSISRSSLSAYWKFYGYNKINRYYFKQNMTYIDAEVTNSIFRSILHVRPLRVNASGMYECIQSGITCTYKISVHDPAEMQYVITSRGQQPWEDTVVSEFHIGLQWTEWTECDGCGGRGERRKFGFCYVMWLDEKEHCPSRDVPPLMRTVARNRREEIIVDVCYDHCSEYEEPLTVDTQRIDVVNGADVKLLCSANTRIASAVRWEREDEVMRRSDVSFGYSASKPVYVSQDNHLVLHNIELPRGGVIRISCVEERTRRNSFDLYVEPLSDIDKVTFLDHLYWIAISSGLQMATFFGIIFIYITIQNCKEEVEDEANFASDEELTSEDEYDSDEESD